MRVVILDGRSRTRSQSNDAQLSDLLSDKLRTAVVRQFHLADLELDPCRGCFACWVKSPGECIIQDKGRDIAEASVNSDVLVIISPVTFGGYSSTVKTALDRLLPNILPLFVRIKGETHHAARYDSYPRLLGIGISSGNDTQDALFAQLVERNALNFHALAHSAHLLQGEDGAISSEVISQTIRRQLTSWGVTM